MVDVSTARFIVGDVREVLDSLPAASVDLVLTSWPFLALRSYLPADHPDKALEIGSEATPGEYIDTLLDVTERCRRVLAPHGSIAMELGDTYAGSGGAGGDYEAKQWRDGQPKFDGSARRDRRVQHDGMPSIPIGTNLAKPGTFSRWQAGDGWPLDKSLCMVPELFRMSLVYGFNPLTGRPTPRWRARNVVRWCRPNPPVGALADKVRPATSDIVVACTSRKRWFDLDAVRTPAQRQADGAGTKVPHGKPGQDGNWHTLGRYDPAQTAGAPPLDHWWHDDEWPEDVFDQDGWLLSTEPYKGAHYATWPSDLCVKPIEAMCPRRVCRTCGEPSRRIVATARTMDGVPADLPAIGDAERAGATANGVGHWRLGTDRETTGWTDCGHDDWRPGVVLDPFAGSGTTLAVAVGHGRDAIGIDLDERNEHLARQRVGFFLTVEHHERTEATA